MNLAFDGGAGRARTASTETNNDRPEPWPGPAPNDAEAPRVRPKTLGAADAMRPLDELRRIWAEGAPWTLFERVVLTLLVLNADNGTKIAVLSLGKFVAQARSSRSTVIRALNALERVAQVLTRSTKKKADGTNEITRYRLHLALLAHVSGRARPDDWGGSVSKTPPKRARLKGGGRVSASSEGVSCWDPGSVPGTLDLLRTLPTTLNPAVAALCPAEPPARPSPSEPHDEAPRAAAGSHDFKAKTEESPPRSVVAMNHPPGDTTSSFQPQGPWSPPGDTTSSPVPSTEGKPEDEDAAMSAAILTELCKHPQLATLTQERHVSELVETAKLNYKSIPVVQLAIRQLAWKVGRGLVRALPAVALGFIASVDPALMNAAQSRSQSVIHKEIPHAQQFMSALARKITAKSIEEQRMGEEAERAQRLAAAREVMNLRHGLPLLTFTAPPAALARLAARAAEVDAAEPFNHLGPDTVVLDADDGEGGIRRLALDSRPSMTDSCPLCLPP